MHPNLPHNKNPRNKPQRHENGRNNEEDDRNDQYFWSVVVHGALFFSVCDLTVTGPGAALNRTGPEPAIEKVGIKEEDESSKGYYSGRSIA